MRPASEAQPGEDPGHGLRAQGIPERLNATRPIKLTISLNTDANNRSGSTMTQSRARRSSGEAFMERRMLHRRVHFHRQIGTSPKLRAVALALGCSESVAERRMYGEQAVNHQSAAIIGVLLCRGEVEDAAAFEAPISAAMIGPVCEPLLDLQRSADESDAYEDVSQAAFVAEKSDESLALYVRKLASDLYHGTRLLAALKAEQAKRAGV